MCDPARLAVHHLLRPDDLASEMLADRLMAKANAEQWPLQLGAGGNELERDSGFVRGPRTGRDQISVGPTGEGVGNRD